MNLKHFLSTLILLLLLIFSPTTHAQPSHIKWSFVLDGYNDVDISDIAVDSSGNTYAAINYTSNLTIPVLNKKLPYAPHVHGLIIKLDNKGKPVWAHPFKSDFDNRIKDISIAPNGDLLITGFGDGLLEFPGLKDTLKAGTAPDKKNMRFTRYQGFYAARYSPKGERLWVKYWNCAWGEGLSIAANKRNEVYMTYYHEHKIIDNGIVIDSFVQNETAKVKIGMAKFSANGELQQLKTLNYIKGSSIISHSIKFDNEDNILLYGWFTEKMKLSEKDSIKNDPYYESLDSYIAKYKPDGKLMWVKQIGGRNTQLIKEISIAPDNSIYATGRYDFECIIGDGIKPIQQSSYEWKSGCSFFYIHLFDDGEMDFVQYIKNKGYNSYFSGQSIATDPSGNVHIIGDFNDTLRVSGFEAAAYHHNFTGAYSYWKKDTLQKLEKIGEATDCWINTSRIAITGTAFASAGMYCGSKSTLNINGKQLLLSNNDYGRSTYIYGGTLPQEKTPPLQPLASKKVMQQNRTKALQPLFACVKPTESPAPDVWFPTTDTITTLAMASNANTSTDSTITRTPNPSPCGEKVTGMEASVYPNPTVNELNVKISGVNGNIQLDIVSADGRLLLTQHIEEAGNEQIITFNLSQLTSGTYFVRLSHSNYQKAIRFVKTN